MTSQRVLAFDDKRTADERFADFDRQHPEVFQFFRLFAGELRERKRRGSARLIGERIRWELSLGIEPDDNGICLNDHYWPRYARKLANEDPIRFGSFFEFRERGKR